MLAVSFRFVLGSLLSSSDNWFVTSHMMTPTMHNGSVPFCRQVALCSYDVEPRGPKVPMGHRDRLGDLLQKVFCTVDDGALAASSHRSLGCC